MLSNAYSEQSIGGWEQKSKSRNNE